MKKLFIGMIMVSFISWNQCCLGVGFTDGLVSLEKIASYPLVLRFLGSNRDIKSDFKSFSLDFESRRGRETCVQRLLNDGCDINQQTGYSKISPLMYAVIGNHPGIVRLLLSCGANPDLKDMYGETALNMAKKRHCCPEVIDMLENPENYECSICLSENYYGERHSLCRQSFHSNCIRDWLSQQRGLGRPETCPMCVQPWR